MPINYELWKSRYLKNVPSDTNLMYVSSRDTANTGNVACVSEAIGFGMLITVLAKDNANFQKLLNFYNKYKNNNGLMSWRVNGQFSVSGDDRSSATDGDLDAAYALLLAGKYFSKNEYTQRGIEVCKALFTHCVNKNLNSLTLGDWVDINSSYATGTRPSDFMLTHIQTFVDIDKERSSGWQKVLDSIKQTCVNQLKFSKHGLIADFLKYNNTTKNFEPVTGTYLESDLDGYYNWNSCRVPMRLGTYVLQNPTDTQLKPLLKALFDFFSSQKQVYAGYRLNGTPLVNYESIAFTAPYYILCKIFDTQKAEQIKQYINTQSNDYYGDSIAMICLLQSQIKPAPISQPQPPPISQPTPQPQPIPQPTPPKKVIHSVSFDLKLTGEDGEIFNLKIK